jgi:mono/diheme cytochrome c family protein
MTTDHPHHRQFSRTGRPGVSRVSRLRSWTGPRLLGVAVTTAVLVLAACADGSVDLPLSEQAQRGQRLYQGSGCAGCHGGDGGGGVGPALVGLRDTERPLLDGTTVIADQDYLVRSIMDPNAQLVDGYSLRMPSNNLSREQVDDIIAFIDELEPTS